MGWGVVLAGLICMELFFRITPVYNTHTINPGLKFVWPDWKNYPLNGYGFRDRMPLDPKPDNVFRILVVGDSFVEGAGLTRQELFGRVLEREANAGLEQSGKRGRVEVVNWGRCGNNAQENVALIRNRALEIKPDLVILEYTLFNDTETHPPTIKSTDTPWWIEKIHSFFLVQVGSYAYYRLFSNFTIFKVDHELELPEAWRNLGYPGMVIGHEDGFKGWVQTRGAFRDFSQWLHVRGVEGAVLVFPLLEQMPRYSSPFLELHAKVDRALEQSRLKRIGLIDLFKIAGLPGRELVLSPTDNHPNALANKLVGEHLAKWLAGRPSFRDWLQGAD